MKLKLSAAMVTLALLSACGGGGGDDDTGMVNQPVSQNPQGQNDNDGTGTVGGTPVENTAGENRDNDNPVVAPEDRTRPASGFFASDDTELKSNGADLFSNTGEQVVNADRVVAWPGLRYGNFLVSNNPWNAGAASYPLWTQEISLYDTGDGYGVEFDWDWGATGDTNGSTFNTKSFLK